jgi:hypothetical protein
MTVAEKIFSLWSADSSATALVPAARFKPGGLYQNIAFPYVVFTRVYDERYRTIAEGAANALEYGTWQFSVHTNGNTAHSTADTIRRKLIDVYDGNKGGFNFHYRASGPEIVSQDREYAMLPVEFLITG